MGTTAWSSSRAGIADLTVSGVVFDEMGQPLPGATVVERGTTNGTVTNLDGKFYVTVSEDAVLVVSFLGYETQEVTVGGRSVLDVNLELDMTSLEDVVVIGYGIQKKENLTGAVSAPDLADMDSRPVTSSSAALQGKVAGVYVLQNSGKPGGDNAVINIRGVGTLNNNDPLVLVDGFPSNINDVNPQDIESMSVLKDASSAAIYGNRAANGVIVITTKKGSKNGISLSYNNYFGIQEATSLPDVLNSEQYTTLHNEASINSGLVPRYSQADIDLYAAGTDPMYPSIDYFDVYYDKAKIQNHRFNLSGGSDRVNVAFMAGYLDQEGILKATDYKKVDFRTNVDAYLLKDNKLRLTTRMSGNRGVKNEPTDEWGAKLYATNSPVWPLKNEQGQWVAVNGERNIFGEIEEGSTRRVERYTFKGQVEAEYEIFDGLSAQVTGGFNVTNENTNSFNANVLLANLDGSTRTLTSDLRENDYRDNQTIFTSLLKYHKTFNKHEIKLLAGYQEEEFSYQWNDAYRKGFLNNSQRYLNLGDGGTMTNNSGAWDLGLQSVFGRINYVFDGKYLFEANIRRDGSSRFADGYKWGTFPSFSAGWILSEEKFLSGLTWLDQFKVRASWGKLGNQNIPNYYAASKTLSNANYSFGGLLNSGVAVSSLVVKETTWETTTQTNFGTDITINQNIDLTIDYFDKKTSDILMQLPIPLTLGNLASPFQNVGEVVNKGIEFAGTYRKTVNKDFSFSSTVTLAHIKNEITDLYGRSPIINGATALVEGSAVNSLYGYEKDGLYQIDDFTWQNNSDTSVPYEDRNYVLKDDVVSVANFNAQPGDLKFKDQSGDNVVTMEDDRKVIGDQYPDFAYSLQLNAKWKGFDLGIFFQGVQGIEGYTSVEIAQPFSGSVSNMGSWWMDRWTPENPTNEYPRVTLDNNRTSMASTFYMEDASYLRLKNLEIGYTLPDRVLSKIGVSSLRIFGNIQNAFTITNYKGFDPEQTVGETRAQAYPQVRVMTAGLNVKF